MAATVSQLNTLEQGYRIADAMLEELQGKGYSEVAVFAVRLAVEEALNNAIRHGNAMDPGKTAELVYEVTEEHVDIRVSDEGPGFNFADVPDPTLDENLDKPTGRGLMLMRAYMDIVEYNDKGNELHMVKFNK
ncbi:MAG: ATP-binding protein [Phycisphaerae bacterium]|nr:ATP-binding protein [Phycisphaerae bacterium]